MLSNAKLLQIGGFELRLHHLIIIGVLAISFSVSAMVRSQGADYGFELNEFDPYHNYRATQFLLDNGLGPYHEWHDDMVWHPHGRDVSETSQNTLHFTAALTYMVFGGDSSLYEHLIIFPVVFGALTAIILFALVRVIAGTSAGLIASLLFAVSVPIITRGSIGWFKSEPLGLFYGILGLYLFVSGIRTENRKMAFARLIGGGITMACALSAWGGNQFFVLPIGVFFLALPFLRKDLKFIMLAAPAFTVPMLVVSSLFDWPGLSFVLAIGGAALVIPTAYVVASAVLQKYTSIENRLRNTGLLLFGIVISGIVGLSINTVYKFLPLSSFRYLIAVNPFLSTEDVLGQSVAEQAVTSTQQSFLFFSILMVFAGLGAWMMLSHGDKLKSYGTKISREMAVFALILAFMGVYISSAFVRLELFASIAVITLASISISVIFYHLLKPGGESKRARPLKPAIKWAALGMIVLLVITPTFAPAQANWISIVKGPPTILNGGTGFGVIHDDWPEAFDWIKANTSKDAVVGSWWDYGYWITTLSNRTSLADNWTGNGVQIQKIATALISNPDRAWHILQEMEADYFLMFVASEKIQESPPLYLLRGGGDESKKQWFMRISGQEPTRKFLFNDGLSGTDYFWEKTLTGHFIPYSPYVYVDPNTNEQSATYKTGYVGVYDRNIKFASNGDGPFKFAFASNSFYRDTIGPITAVLIYEVNKDYVPGSWTSTSPARVDIADAPAVEAIAPGQEAPARYAQVTTSLGEFTIELDSTVAPNTVKNFADLANEGFYDNTIFHRIIPDYIVQGGDPNTRLYGREAWGTGDPGYTIEPEFNDLSHTKYAVSMARGEALDSAGSQFFIMLGDAPILDGQYTIFGRVVEGQDIVDQLGMLETTSNDQPVDALEAIIERVIIE